MNGIKYHTGEPRLMFGKAHAYLKTHCCARMCDEPFNLSMHPRDRTKNTISLFPIGKSHVPDNIGICAM
jgi:hypothetical protein